MRKYKLVILNEGEAVVKNPVLNACTETIYNPGILRYSLRMTRSMEYPYEIRFDLLNLYPFKTKEHKNPFGSTKIRNYRETNKSRIDKTLVKYS